MIITPARLVLITAFVVLLFNSGARFAMGLMLRPMTEDLGWSRTTLSSTVTLFLIVSAAALPFAGQLVDRLGARLVLAMGVVVSSVAIALMGFIETPLQAFLLYGILFAIGSAATSVTPIGVMLTHWYPHRMGMANSIAISGMGLGQLLIIAVLASQLMVMGWRGSFLMLGVATLICVLPLVMLADRGKPPAAPEHGATGKTTTQPIHAAMGQDETATSLSQVLSIRRMWVLLFMYAICGFQDFLIATHVVAFALDEGVDPLLGGNMLAFMGLAGLLGVLLTGALNDRYGPVLPTLLCFIVRILIFGLILISRDPFVIVGVALLYGFTFWMTAPLAVVFAWQVCGLALLGTVSGLITMVHHMAGGVGAFVGAWVFDTFGSYDGALVTLLLVSIVALILTPSLRSGKQP